jgi:hypothetical protein
MSTQRRESKNRRSGRGRVFLLEHLEERQLLATVTEAFSAPSLSGLISQAWQGKNTAQAAINTMLKSLQTQLTNGPLADLSSSAVDGNGFVTEVQSLVTSYNQNVDQQLLPHFTHIDEMLKLQGQKVVGDVVSLNQQDTVGLLVSGNLPMQAGAAIDSLTGGPIHSLNTPVSAYVTTTQTFETNLGVLAATLSTTGSPALTIADVNTTLQAEAEAYRADMGAGLQVTHPNIFSTVDAAVTTLEDAVNTSASNNNSTAESEVHAAIAAFDTAILDTTGLFGPQGPVIQVNTKLGYVPHNLTGKQGATTLDSVSGTASFGGSATLTATLNSANGTGLIGKVVTFTLEGAFAGTAVTDSSGVATLTGVPTSDSAGTVTGAVVASFAGDSTNKLSQNSGDLVVSQASTTTTLASNANPSVSGQSVMFTATVAAVSPSSGTPTGTVTFKDGTTTLGTGTLNGSGVATFSTTSLSVATHPITAVYAGDANFITSSTSSAVSQVVNHASTTTALVSNLNPSVSGQSVTFTATVAATSPGSGTPTGTVNFLDNLTAIGSNIALTAGVATFPTITLAAGSHSITAVYAGDTNFTTSTSAVLSQAVNQAPVITSAAAAPFTAGTAGTFTVTTTGFPISVLSETGTLPTGVTFVDNHNGTATLASTAATAAGTSQLTINATNGVTPNATQPFTLTVS